MAILAGLAFVVGVVVGALYTPPEKEVAERFAQAWQKGDYDAMHAELSAAAKSRYPITRFRDAYAMTAATATATTISVGDAKSPKDGTVSVPVTVRTRVFGTVRGTLRLPFDGNGQDARIDWRPELTFPGVEQGQALQRRTELPRRGTILARDGQALAKGPDRSTSLTAAAAETVGELGPIPPEQRLALRGLGPSSPTVSAATAVNDVERSGPLASTWPSRARIVPRRGSSVRRCSACPCSTPGKAVSYTHLTLPTN